MLEKLRRALGERRQAGRERRLEETARRLSEKPPDPSHADAAAAEHNRLSGTIGSSGGGAGGF